MFLVPDEELVDQIKVSSTLNDYLTGQPVLGIKSSSIKVSFKMFGRPRNVDFSTWWESAWPSKGKKVWYRKFKALGIPSILIDDGSGNLRFKKDQAGKVLVGWLIYIGLLHSHPKIAVMPTTGVASTSVPQWP